MSESFTFTKPTTTTTTGPAPAAGRAERIAALHAGLLLDVTVPALACGFMAPVAITAALWELVSEPAPIMRERMLLLLRAVRTAAEASDEAEVRVPAAILGGAGHLLAFVDADDDGPMITVSWPGCA